MKIKVAVYFKISITFYDPPRFFLRPTGGSRPIVWETLFYTIIIFASTIIASTPLLLQIASAPLFVYFSVEVKCILNVFSVRE